MIKEIIATVLLTGSVSAKSLKDLKPQKAFSNELYGAYCLRDVESYYVPGLEMSYDIDLDFYDLDNGPLFYASAYNQYCKLNYLEIEYGYVRHNPDYMGYYIAYEYHVLIGGQYEDIETITTVVASNDRIEDEGYDDLPQELMECVFYFPETIYVNVDGLKVFNALFGPSANPYVHYYTGWYTFNYNIESANTYYTLYGSVTVNNYLYSSLHYSHDTDGSYIYANNYPNINTRYQLYDEHYWHGKNNCYFTGVLIPDWVYQRMLTTGTFNFIPDEPDVDLKNYLFEIMDAPVYVLYSLFNFELLGVNLAIALTGLLTIAMVFFLFKKIIN